MQTKSLGRKVAIAALIAAGLYGTVAAIGAFAHQRDCDQFDVVVSGPNPYCNDRGWYDAFRPYNIWSAFTSNG